MPSVIDCPSCTRKLRVPEELVGQEVKCPTCGTTFTAQESGPEPAPRSAPPPPPREELEPPRSSRRSSRPRYDDEDDDYENRRRPRRRHLEPHRGSTIQMLGILSFFIAGFILGPMAWIMGSSDLKAMREGRMDPSGESETNTGRICGMISTLLHVGGV
ncbi:MAG TPA: MJ0042-type zinc finger domain-containing protein, partial [Gemmataceae bacterium]|nr:MJ0042-type zinc finger domain-containing protein [Gemmataceae bacterium]